MKRVIYLKLTVILSYWFVVSVRMYSDVCDEPYCRGSIKWGLIFSHGRKLGGRQFRASSAALGKHQGYRLLLLSLTCMWLSSSCSQDCPPGIKFCIPDRREEENGRGQLKLSFLLRKQIISLEPSVGSFWLLHSQNWVTWLLLASGMSGKQEVWTAHVAALNTIHTFLVKMELISVCHRGQPMVKRVQISLKRKMYTVSMYMQYICENYRICKFPKCQLKQQIVIALVHQVGNWNKSDNSHS